MADITRLSVVGDWRVVVESRNAGWQQHVVCLNTATGDETIQGTPGASLDIRGSGTVPWQLGIQHNDGQSGWRDSWLRPGALVVSGSDITRRVESEDTTTGDSDRDFDDLVVRLEKLGMVDQPTRPFAIEPGTMQMMPDGIFEASLGRYYLAVRIRNVWTAQWPATARVDLTSRCRQWLAAGGVEVIDAWSGEDAATLGQAIVGGQVEVGSLSPWETTVVYFKVNVTNAQVRKHLVEVAVIHPDAEATSHLNPDATSQMMVSRTTYDPAKKVFVSACDRGTLTASIEELVVDHNSFIRAMGVARELFGKGGPSSATSLGPLGDRGCSQAVVERVRADFRRFIDGDPTIDLCDLWQAIQCCCTGDRFGRDNDDDWSARRPTGLEFLAFPSVIDYRVEYHPGYEGQYGPLPYDDPWWKLLLKVIAIILSACAAASTVADLANRSDRVVIGQVLRSILKKSGGTVDAAVVRLNGQRGLRPAVFSYLDAASDEVNNRPVTALNGIIDTSGLTMSNAQIKKAIDAFTLDPTSATAQAGVRVFKSGARTGVTYGRMTAVDPLGPREDGVSFIDQVLIEEDPSLPNQVSNSGDSGSLWLHSVSKAIVALNHTGSREANTAWGSRIEDVMKNLKVRFA